MSERIGRRSLLGFGIGVALGVSVDRAASLWFGGNTVPLTMEERTMKRSEDYEQLIRKLHGRPAAEVWPHHISASSENMFVVHLRSFLPEATSFVKILGNHYFCRSRFKKGYAEIRQGKGLYQRYISKTINDLITGVPEPQDWRLWSFTPFGALDPRENSNYGSIQLWIPTASLPNDRFLFTLAHNREINQWIQRPVDSWNAVVRPNNLGLTIVDIESYDPTKQPVSGQSKDPVYDRFVVIVTDLQGEPIAQKIYVEPSWDGYIRGNSPFRNEPPPEAI